MPYLHEIVDILNQKLAAGKLSDDHRFVKNIRGIAEPLPRNYDNEQTIIPTIVDLNGGTEFSGFDDAYSIVIYHRLIQTTNVESAVAFGDGTTMREEASMRMIVFADRLRIQLQPSQLNMLLSGSIQKQLKSSELQSFAGLLGATIQMDSTNYKGVQIWSDEYRLPVNLYPVAPHQIYMALDYTIITDYDVTCISDCPTC